MTTVAIATNIENPSRLSRGGKRGAAGVQGAVACG